MKYRQWESYVAKKNNNIDAKLQGMQFGWYE